MGSNPVEATWKFLGAHMRHLLRLSSKCEDHFFNSSLNRTSQTFLHSLVTTLIEEAPLFFTVACLIDQSANWTRQFCRSEGCFWQNRDCSGKMIQVGYKLSVWQIRCVSYVAQWIRPVSSHKWKASLAARKLYCSVVQLRNKLAKTRNSCNFMVTWVNKKNKERTNSEKTTAATKNN